MIVCLDCPVGSPTNSQLPLWDRDCLPRHVSHAAYRLGEYNAQAIVEKKHQEQHICRATTNILHSFKVQFGQLSKLIDLISSRLTGPTIVLFDPQHTNQHRKQKNGYIFVKDTRVVAFSLFCS